MFRDYAQLIRLPAMFTVCSNVIAAHLIAVVYWSGVGVGIVQSTTLLLTMLASLCLYHGGMVLNDCCDYDIDRHERPERPLPSGKVKRKTAWLIAFTMLLLGFIFAALISFQTATISAILVVAIIAYDGGPRQGWRAAINMGICRYLNWLMAISAIGLNWELALLPIPILCYVTALTRISQDEVQATSPTMILKAAGLILAGSCCWLAWFIFGLFNYHLALIALVAVLILLALRFLSLYRDYNPDSVKSIVSTLLFGIIPLDALLLLSSGQIMAAVLLLLLLFPGKLAGRFIYVT